MTLTVDDHREIAELGAAFAALLDERRFPEVADLFVEDGELHRADGSLLRGRSDILAAQSSRHEHVDTVHHSATPFIEEGGEPSEARSRTSFVAVSVNRQDHSTAGWAIGYFEDRYRKENGLWRFTERHIHLMHRR